MVALPAWKSSARRRGRGDVLRCAAWSRPPGAVARSDCVNALAAAYRRRGVATALIERLQAEFAAARGAWVIFI